MKDDDCGHAPPRVYHVESSDLQTGAVKRRVSYCAACAALIVDYHAGAALDKALEAIPKP